MRVLLLLAVLVFICKTQVCTEEGHVRKCLPCTDADPKCSECTATGTLNSPRCSKCQPGYRLSQTFACEACKSGCDECESATNCCDTCLPGFYPSGDDCLPCNDEKCMYCYNDPGICTRCIAGYGPDAHGICESCVDNCAVCYSTSASCNVCNEGWSVDGTCGGLCKECTVDIPNCDLCEGEAIDECLICSDGYRLNGLGGCEKCNLPNCRSCTSDINSCVSNTCYEGYWFYSAQCNLCEDITCSQCSDTNTCFCSSMAINGALFAYYNGCGEPGPLPDPDPEPNPNPLGNLTPEQIAGIIGGSVGGIAVIIIAILAILGIGVGIVICCLVKKKKEKMEKGEEMTHM